jgi:hypothetical protein
MPTTAGPSLSMTGKAIPKSARRISSSAQSATKIMCSQAPRLPQTAHGNAKQRPHGRRWREHDQRQCARASAAMLGLNASGRRRRTGARRGQTCSLSAGRSGNGSSPCGPITRVGRSVACICTDMRRASSSRPPCAASMPRHSAWARCPLSVPPCASLSWPARPLSAAS